MNETKNVAVIGNGGRESAFIHMLLKDPSIAAIFWFGNNAGYPNDPHVIRTNIKPNDKAGIVRASAEMGIDLVISGPELPALNGTNDSLRELGIPVFGASLGAIQIETDKAWARETMRNLDLPQPYFEVHQNIESAKKALRRDDRLRVVKAAGPCEGKGVMVCDTYEEAVTAAESMLVEGKFGEAGRTIVLEERLGWHDPQAQEISVMYFSDGQQLLELPLARDYKREFDGDRGQNTGSMGCHTAPESLSPEEQAGVLNSIAYPLINELASQGNAFIGILYVSLMRTGKGIFVIEINGRGGDPETVVQLAGISHPNISEFLIACAQGEMGLAESPTWDDQEYLDVVLCAKEYPEGRSQGEQITGLEAAKKIAHTIFHAGTARDGRKTITNGGRILHIVGHGATRDEARTEAYQAIEKIKFAGEIPKYRTDIGAK